MGTQGMKKSDACARTDAHGAIKRGGTAGKRAEQVPHVGSQRGHVADKSLYRSASTSKSNK
jgi:hypothetical protein